MLAGRRSERGRRDKGRLRDGACTHSAIGLPRGNELTTEANSRRHNAAHYPWQIPWRWLFHTGSRLPPPPILYDPFMPRDMLRWSKRFFPASEMNLTPSLKFFFLILAWPITFSTIRRSFIRDSLDGKNTALFPLLCMSLLEVKLINSLLFSVSFFNFIIINTGLIVIFDSFYVFKIAIHDVCSFIKCNTCPVTSLAS